MQDFTFYYKMLVQMKELYNKWRYYSLGREEYIKCMEKTFHDNVSRLIRVNGFVAVLSLVFMIFPVFVENNFFKARFYLITAIVAVIFLLITTYIYKLYNQEKKINKYFVYALITFFYTNTIFLGIYLGVWANPGHFAVSFMCILICALFFFNISPVFYLCHTLGAMILFIAIVINIKPLNIWSIDVVNTLFAGFISLYFGWQITMFRISSSLKIDKLLSERNNYYDQCTIDELTQLKNRRDFFQTFKRFLENYRQSDNFLCLGILDIDLFKNYNDHYGHPQGDECLRILGKALASLRESSKIYSARIGGEEFALLWFEKEASNAEKIASDVSQMIRDLNIKHEKSSIAPYVTISIGVRITPCGSSSDTQGIYDLADKALYAAKSGGRNRFVISS